MKVIVAGDFCPRNRVAELINKNEYSTVLGETKGLFSETDYSIVNLECPVSEKNNLTPIAKNGPNLIASKKTVEALLWANIKCVTLANNHILDFGEDGFKDTLQILDEKKIEHVGGGSNLQQAAQTFYTEIKGKKLAIINCCEHEFSIATENTAGSNPLNPIQQYYAIQEAKIKADRVLVIIHGGHEHFQLPSPRMVETYRFFVDAGADAVVNHHQHCYCGYEIYKGRPIFYGIGNFCFDHPTKQNGNWTEGYMVSLDFSAETLSFEIHPYKQCADEPRIELLAKDAFNEQLKELNAIIADRDKLIGAVEKHYASCINQYSSIFEPLRNRLYIAAKRRGWLPSLISKKCKLEAENYILCEAHRDRMTYWLKNNDK